MEKPFMEPFYASQWLAWAASTLVACIMLTAFFYTNFQTRAAAIEQKSDLVQRLDRIEGKVDLLISK